MVGLLLLKVRKLLLKLDLLYNFISGFVCGSSFYLVKLTIEHKVCMKFGVNESSVFLYFYTFCGFYG